MRVVIKNNSPQTALKDVPNGSIFQGTIDGYWSAGPFIKIGSFTTKEWVVAKLEAMEGAVWTSGRNGEATISHYRRLDIESVVLNERTE